MKIYFSRPDAFLYLGDVAWNKAKMEVRGVRWGAQRNGNARVEFNGFGSMTDHSARRPNTRNWQEFDDYAATWDQWGVLLSNVFAVDAQAKVGGFKHPYYDGADDFHHQTGDRFKRVFTLEDLLTAALYRGEPGHHDHVFRYDPSLGGFNEHVSRCIKGRNDRNFNQCTAVQVRG